jgi:hypothetical protein
MADETPLQVVGGWRDGIPAFITLNSEPGTLNGKSREGVQRSRAMTQIAPTKKVASVNGQ